MTQRTTGMASSNKPVVLVTGTSSGIGLSLAHKLWKNHHYRAVITARASSLPKLELAGFNNTDNFFIRTLDITRAKEREALILEIAECWGGVDILINNAGISFRSVIEHMTEQDNLSQLRTNFLAPLELIRLVLPKMRMQRWGRIINVSSVSGMMAMPTMGSYSASKFALEGASEALWYELRPWNIKVSLIQPGFIHSNSFNNVRWSKNASQAFAKRSDYFIYYEKMSAFIERLMKNAWATPESVAAKIMRVIEDKNPPLRVSATPDAYFFFILRRLLPRSLYHWLLWRNLPGVDKWGLMTE